MDWNDHLQVAEGFLELGMPQDAHDEIERMPAEDKVRPEVYALRLRVYLFLEKWDLADVCARHMTRVSPKNPNVWLARAEAVRRLQGAEAADEVFQEACAHFPENGEILYGLACSAARQGDVTRAKVYLATAISHDGGLRARALDDEALRAVWDDIGNMGQRKSLRVSNYA